MVNVDACLKGMYPLYSAQAVAKDQELHEALVEAKGHQNVQTTYALCYNTPAVANYVPPAPACNPYTMDMDATAINQQAWRLAMNGKCFKCMSTTHLSHDCPHAQSLCCACSKVGHVEAACKQQ